MANARVPPSGVMVSTRASRALRATAMSEGWVAMQALLWPKMAAPRFRPPMAAQPAPGWRLLQGLVVS